MSLDQKHVTSKTVIDGYRRVLAFVYAIAVHEENISDSKIILRSLSRIFCGYPHDRNKLRVPNESSLYGAMILSETDEKEKKKAKRRETRFLLS